MSTIGTTSTGGESGTPSTPSTGSTPGALFGVGVTGRRVNVRDIAAARERGHRWPMLTAYDALTARVFEEAGIPVLLVGDSAANTVLGYDSTIPVTVDELLPLTAAVVRGTSRAMVIGDLPFGSYQGSPGQALDTATRFLKEAGAHAVKLEGGFRVAGHVELLVSAGIPVMAHLGLTPQSERTLGGLRVQARGDEAGEQLLAEAKALQEAGAFAVVLEAVPRGVAGRVTGQLKIPTIGVGAGPDCDAQVLVWPDMAGFTTGQAPRFVKRYADMAGTLTDAARRFGEEVAVGDYPDDVHSYH